MVITYQFPNTSDVRIHEEYDLAAAVPGTRNTSETERNKQKLTELLRKEEENNRSWQSVEQKEWVGDFRNIMKFDILVRIYIFLSINWTTVLKSIYLTDMLTLNSSN